jgi:putative SOS response-associated peptidase YedK
MCGRYDLSDSPAAIRAKFSVPAVPDFLANPDLRPTDSAPIVRLDKAGARECVLARWGLVPFWAKELKFGNRCINARAETVATTPAFKAAYKARRCLVPVSAFYEWTGPIDKKAGHKVKWRISVPGEPLFALAGLWEWWRDPAHKDQPGVETYTIITTDASAQLAPIHDRMPVIVPESRHAAWLDPAQDASGLLAPDSAELTLTS